MEMGKYSENYIKCKNTECFMTKKYKIKSYRKHRKYYDI